MDFLVNFRDKGTLTTGETIARLRKMPEMREFIESVYYDEDVLHAGRRFHASEEFQAVLARIARQKQPGSLVLDMGGGNGVAALAWHQAGYRVVMVEPDESDVVGIGCVRPILQQGGYNIRAYRATGEALPLPANLCDIFYCRQVLHHVTDLELVCKEAYRVLKPHGLFVATREHVISSPDDLQIFLQKHPLHKYTGQENAHPLDRYVHAIRKAGFRHIKVLGPWQSVINYYPTSEADFQFKVARFLSRFVGPRIGQQLSAHRLVRDYMGKLFSARKKTPGRLYSFWAVR